MESVGAMRVSVKGAADIETREGFRATPYQDEAGVWTQGVGETAGITRDSPPVSYVAARARFLSLLQGVYASEVSRLLADAPTTQDQFDVMVSLAYNIGLANFARSTVLRAHKAGDYDAATAAFAMWNKVTDPVTKKLIVNRGLTIRRAAEASIYHGPATVTATGSATPSVDSEKPLAQTRSVAGGTLAALATTMSVVAQVSSSIKDTAGNVVGVAGEFGNTWVVLGVAGGVIAFAGICWALYARWADRQAGNR